jgi:hypothetical protein
MSDGSEISGYAFLAPLVGYDYGSIAEGFTILAGAGYWNVYLPLVAPLSLLFVIQVFRCMTGKTPQNRAHYSGLLSLVFPGLFLTWTYIPFFLIGQYGYAGPIPIQFIMGMVLVSKYGHHFEGLEWVEQEEKGDQIDLIT